MSKETVEREFKTPQEEILHLKYRIGGMLRGREMRMRQIEDLNKCVRELLDERLRNEKIIEELEKELASAKKTLDEQKSKIYDLSSDKVIMEGVIKEYKALPWYKKIFIK